MPGRRPRFTIRASRWGLVLAATLAAAACGAPASATGSATSTLPHLTPAAGTATAQFRLCTTEPQPPCYHRVQGPLAAAISATESSIQKRADLLGVTVSIHDDGNGLISVSAPLPLDQVVYLFARRGAVWFASAALGSANPQDPAFLRDQMDEWDPAQLASPAIYAPGWHWKIDPVLGQESFASVTVGQDQKHAPSLDIQFQGGAAGEWNQITNAAYQAFTSSGSVDNPRARIAVFLDGVIISTPVVTGANQGSATSITGIGSTSSVAELAAFAETAAFPADVVVETSDVTPAPSNPPSPTPPPVAIPSSVATPFP